MDADRFDRLTRTLAARLPRRGALRWIGGLSLGALLGAARGTSPAAAEACGPDQTACRVRRNGKTRTVCVSAGQCCPGFRRCDDGACVRGCCADERPCPSGSGCAAGDACCPEERTCPLGDCVYNQCCPGERPCPKKVNGRVRLACVPEPQCCPGKKTCPGGECIDQNACCPDERECRTRVGKKVRKSCVPMDECCPKQKKCGAKCIDKTTCCPSTETACASDPKGCCSSFVGEECTLVDGCCGGIDSGERPCDGTWCCKADEECVLGEGCRPQECGSGLFDCPDLTGFTWCCREGTRCCNGTCCAFPDIQKCCPGRAGCWAMHVDC